jgi:hypothetical protein
MGFRPGQRIDQTEVPGVIVPCGTINDTSFIFFRVWLSSGAIRVGRHRRQLVLIGK